MNRQQTSINLEIIRLVVYHAAYPVISNTVVLNLIPICRFYSPYIYNTLVFLVFLFRPERYDLFLHNCNTFSNEVAQFLTGKKIPSHITDLPQDVMSTPFGAMISQFIQNVRVHPSALQNGGTPPNDAPTLHLEDDEDEEAPYEGNPD